jgi:hypothetical protein
VALPRRCRPSVRHLVLPGSFWSSLTVVTSCGPSPLVLVGDVALPRCVAARCRPLSRTCWGVLWLWLVVDGCGVVVWWWWMGGWVGDSGDDGG